MKHGTRPNATIPEKSVSPIVNAIAWYYIQVLKTSTGEKP
jgi:hypothetical protein